jgi:hypothetical protein
MNTMKNSKSAANQHPPSKKSWKKPAIKTALDIKETLSDPGSGVDAMTLHPGMSGMS